MHQWFMCVTTQLKILHRSQSEEAFKENTQSKKIHEKLKDALEAK